MHGSNTKLNSTKLNDETPISSAGYDEQKRNMPTRRLHRRDKSTSQTKKVHANKGSMGLEHSICFYNLSTTHRYTPMKNSHSKVCDPGQQVQKQVLRSVPMARLLSACHTVHVFFNKAAAFWSEP